MSAVDAAGAPAPAPATLVSLLALYRLLLRMQITAARLLGIAGLGALAILIGLFTRWDDNPAQAPRTRSSPLRARILVPFAALWLGTSAIGDLVDDRLLVYLWLKPVARWQLPAAAVLATVTVVVPLTAVPLAASALVAGAGDVAPAAFLAASLAALAYAGLFVAAGLWFRRAVWWGLAFVLVWENVVAHTAEGAAAVHGPRLGRVRSRPGARRRRVGHDGRVRWRCPRRPRRGAVAGWLAATWRYRRADIAGPATPAWRRARAAAGSSRSRSSSRSRAGRAAC